METGSHPLLQAELSSGSEDAPQRIALASLLGARRELLIVHNGREYRLRLTQNDKLILTA